MGHRQWWAWLGLTTLLAGGCATGPLEENPFLLRPERLAPQGNPVFVAQGPASYGAVFEKVIDIIDDYWEISYANRYDGRIETFPEAAPGLGQLWKPGSPDFYQRYYATNQSIRHRAIVLIQPARDGGYFIDVKVLKELEDLERPLRATASSVTFRSEPTVERQYEVVDGPLFDSSWIPIGRDCKLEQCILSRLAKFDPSECQLPPPQPVK